MMESEGELPAVREYIEERRGNGDHFRSGQGCCEAMGQVENVETGYPMRNFEPAKFDSRLEERMAIIVVLGRRRDKSCFHRLWT